MAEEIAPTLAQPPGIELPGYCAQLMTRFRNAALPHRTRQIAMDGSQKLPQRLLGPIRDRLAAGASIRHLTLAVAGWIRYASGTDERGAPIDVQDPLAEVPVRLHIAVLHQWRLLAWHAETARGVEIADRERDGALVGNVGRQLRPPPRAE